MILSPNYDGPPILSIPGDPNDQLVPVVRQRRRLEAMLVDLHPAQWAAASRCAGWTVQDVVAHLVGVNSFWNGSVQAGLAGRPTRFLANFDPAATPPLMVNSMSALSTVQVLDQFKASNDTLFTTISELDDDQWGMIAESPPGHVSIRLVAHHALWDCWVHERDIALPLGVVVDEEGDELVSCLRYSSALSPALAIGWNRPREGRYIVKATDPPCTFTLHVDQQVTVVNDDLDNSVDQDPPCLTGRAVDLVEALSMRIELPTETPQLWRELLSGIAMAFDPSSQPSQPSQSS